MTSLMNERNEGSVQGFIKWNFCKFEICEDNLYEFVFYERSTKLPKFLPGSTHKMTNFSGKKRKKYSSLSYIILQY